MLRLARTCPPDAACFGSSNHTVTGLAHLATGVPCGCYREQRTILCSICLSEVESQPLSYVDLPNVDHMVLLWTILPMNASEGISRSRCGRQSHCSCWLRKILNVVSSKLSNADNGTTVLYSAPSYQSTPLASISCMSHCVPEGTAPSQAKTCQSEFAWKERRARPCSLRRGEAANAIGAQIPIRTVFTSVRDFCVV